MEPLTEPHIFQWLATLGVGGILAAFMFHFYRKDTKEHQEQLKEFLNNYRSDSIQWKEVVIANTDAMAKCTLMTEQVFKYLIDTHDLVKQNTNIHQVK